MINFGGNDYLGLAKDSRLIEALQNGALKFGISPSSSRIGLGWNDTFQKLENDLSTFFDLESATIFASGFLGGLIYFETMRGYYDTVYCDENCHINIGKGISAAGLKVIKFRHLDLEHLQQLINENGAAKAIIASDGMWGRSGEKANINEIVKIANKIGGEVLIDDAHGVFSIGKHGRGVIDSLELKTRNVTILGSMCKALGCFGGFLAGSANYINQMKNNPISISSTTIAIPIASACVRALEIINTNPQLLKNLESNSQKMRKVLSAKGISFYTNEGPVLGLNLKDEKEAKRLSEHFIKNNILVPYFSYTSEPRKNILRIVAKSNYSIDDLMAFEKAVQAF